MHVNLLIVDDISNQLESLDLALKTKGHTAVIAGGGEEALEKLNALAFQIDAVVTDYDMPGMNGLEFLEIVREKNLYLPVIIMTAYGEKELLVNAFRNGCDGFIEKPFTFDQLLLEIERVMSMSKKRESSWPLSKRIYKLMDTINDKLTVISGNTEIAMIGLEMNDPESEKMRLQMINEVSKDISFIKQEIVQLLEAP
jgi:DNA-binding NtrC family response regulator